MDGERTWTAIKMHKNEIKNKKIVIVSHIYATGPTHALENFLKGKVKKLAFIGHPFIFAKDTRSHMRLYKSYRKKPVVKFKSFFIRNEFISLIKDLILTPYWVIRNGRFDLYIGADCFNALPGIFLKKIGYVDKTVFYTIDYIPKRFPNKIMNSIYHGLDTFCVKNSDIVWNLSEVMVLEREKKGVPKKNRSKQIVVPMGTERNVKQIPISRLKRHTAVHMGHLIPKQGLQLVIESISEIVKKVPKFHLDIIGSGSYEEELKRLAKKLKVDKHITWHGFIKNHSDVEKMLSFCAFGLAPYTNSPDNYIQYTDPGKVKAYLAAGLPIIITDVTKIASEIKEKNCGFSIRYLKKDIVNACINLLTDDDLLKQMKKNVDIMGKSYSWENIFSNSLEKTIGNNYD